MPTNIRGEKTRGEILDAAWDLISEQGADVSVSKIAAAVGVTRQTIYLHFGSRGCLLVALEKRADERFEIKDQFDAALKKREPKERLAMTLQAWLTFVPKIYPIAKDLIRLREKDSEAAAAWAIRMDEIQERLLNLMRSLQGDGALKEGWTPERASQFFWAQTSVQVWGLLRKDFGWSDDVIARSLQSALAHSLLRGNLCSKIE